MVACAAGVTSAAPVETLTTVQSGPPVSISVLIADGHAGTTGFQVAYAHQQVIPWTVGAFVIGDNDTHTYDLEGYGNSGAWSLITYNTDNRAHLWQVKIAYMSTDGAGTQRKPNPLSVHDIYAHLAAAV